MGAPGVCDACAREALVGHAAARADHVECLKEYYKENGHPVNLAAPEDKYTPLHWAALKGNVQSVRALLWLGAAVDPLEKSNWTPLQLACMRGHDAIVKVLLVHGANPELQDKRNSTAVHKAAGTGSLACLQTLLKRNPRVDIRDSIGWTPVHCAAFGGRLSCIQYLVRCGASVIDSDEVGDTPLHLAASEGHGECAKLLLQAGANPDAKNADGETPRDVAVRLRRDDVIAHLDLLEIEQKIARLQSGEDNNDDESIGPCDACHSTRFAVHAAAYNGHLLCLRREIAWHNGDVNAADDEGYLPLHRASEGGHAHCVRWLLEHGVFPWARTSEGKTARDLATESGHHNCEECLPRNEDEPENVPQPASDASPVPAGEEEVPLTEQLARLQKQLDEERERYHRLQVALAASGGDGLASLLEHERAKRENLESLLEQLREQLTRAAISTTPRTQPSSAAPPLSPSVQGSQTGMLTPGRILSRPQSARKPSTTTLAAPAPRSSYITPLKGGNSLNASNASLRSSGTATSSDSPTKRRKSRKKGGIILAKEPDKTPVVLASVPSRFSR